MVLLGRGRYTYEVSGVNWGKIPEGWFYKEVASVDVDSRDNVYVFNRGNHPMIVLDREGNVLRSWGEGGVFTNPHGVTIGPDDTVWCVDNLDHSIRQFTPEGKLLFTLRERNKPAPAMSGVPVHGPTKVAIDPRNGDILVADGYGNAKVHRFAPNGKLKHSFGESGTDLGHFNIVHDISIDPEGAIYIGDRENRRIQIFNPRGKLEARWPDFSRTAAVHVPRNGMKVVLVGEYFGGGVEGYRTAMRLGPRVSVMSPEGKVLARLSDQPYGDEPGRFYAPHHLTMDSRGDIYVAEVAYAEFGRMMKPPREIRSFQKLVRQRQQRTAPSGRRGE
ncbi:MAG: peptidyl-alpha-hydroxyglycine alpha-amidating lyase family protein [Chloroflexota bacterium]|nr:peptidyl-alpha-hydroxyglycine alpha-amidating lyase family protein [Chloroflexota bacterium]